MDRRVLIEKHFEQKNFSTVGILLLASWSLGVQTNTYKPQVHALFKRVCTQVIYCCFKTTEGTPCISASELEAWVQFLKIAQIEKMLVLDKLSSSGVPCTLRSMTISSLSNTETLGDSEVSLVIVNRYYEQLVVMEM